MKRRMQVLLALSLSASMIAAGSTYSYAEEIAAVQTAEEASSAADSNAEAAQEQQAEEPANEQTEPAIPTETEERSSETSQSEPQTDHEEKKSPSKKSAAEDASADIPESTSVDIEDFQLAEISVQTIDEENILVTISTAKDTFDQLYVGAKEDEAKEPAVVGIPNEWGGYSFTFPLSIATLDQDVTVVPSIRETGEWYTDMDILIHIPEHSNEKISYLEETDETANVVPEAVLTEETTPEILDESQGTVSAPTQNNSIWGLNDTLGSEETDKTTEADPALDEIEENVIEQPSSDYEETKTVADEELTDEQAALLEELMADEIPDLGGVTTAIDNSTTLADGTYTPNKFTFTGGSGKLTISCSEITVKEGKSYAKISLSSSSIAYLKANNQKFTNCVPEGTGLVYTDIPIALNIDNDIILLSTAMSEPHEIAYKIHADLTSGQITPENGIYNVKVINNNKMFNIVNNTCILTVKDGKMTAAIPLNGTGYSHMYAGTKENAAAAAENTWSAAYEMSLKDESTGETKNWFTYNVEVSALDQEIPISAKGTKSGNWFDRPLTFLSEGMVKTGEILPDPEPTAIPTITPTVTPKPTTTPKPTATPKPTTTTKPTSAPSKNDSKNNSDNGSSNNGNSKTTGGGGSSKTADNKTSGSSNNGTTSQVDNSTALEDGEYTAGQFDFSWSGGSGKVDITCDRILIQNGQAYATIAFSSSHYTYVKASGSTYYPDHSAGNSVFEIPVQLNANNKIIGQTTAMSQPHEIEYTLYFGLEGATSAESTSTDVKTSKTGGGGSFSANKGKGNTTPLSEKAKELDGSAPKIAGLNFEKEIEFKEAKYAKLFQYDQGFYLLEIDAFTKTAKDNGDSENITQTVSDTQSAQNEVTETAADRTEELYKAKVIRYLIAPEGKDLPAGIEKDVIVIKQPVEKVYAASDEAVQMMEKLSLLDQLSAVSDASASQSEAVKNSESFISAGSFEKADYKKLLKNKCDLAILPAALLPKKDSETDSGHSVTAEDFEKIVSKYALLKIPMLLDRSADEETDAAKAEWCKVYGAVFNCMEQAEQLTKEVKE